MADSETPQRGQPARVLVTAAGPQMRPALHECALPTFARFAARWGYAMHVVDLPGDGVGADTGAQQAKWMKIALLRQALCRFALAVWLDADVLLVRDDEDIAGHLQPGHFQALAIEQVPYEHRVNPNTGVWVMRSCPMAFEFLDAVQATGPQPGPWADQGTVLAVLGWDRGDSNYWWARPGPGSRYLAGTSWLPPGWNQPYLDGRAPENLFNSAAASYQGRPTVADPHAVHFMGMTPAARYRHMARLAATLPRRPAWRRRGRAPRSGAVYGDGMKAWAVHGVELPYGDEAGSWWIDAAGSMDDRPIAGAEHLPGRYFLAGLVDAHAHPGVGAGPTGLVPLDKASARANLIAWAQAGITLVRDVGSPGGLTLEIDSEPGMPEVRAAGRFLAPRDHYFPGLLGAPVEEPDLVRIALDEVGRGAKWVKVIADFRDLAAGGAEAEPTYSIDSIAQLIAAVHDAGARVAVHSTLANAGQLVAAGVDSIEHGFGLDEHAIKEMARRGTARTPTIGALLALLDTPGMAPEHHARLQQGRARLADLLPRAVRLGVPVLAGTDVTGSIPREVALLSQMGLEPKDALAAASVWPRRFIGGDATTADVVTYHRDPRDDPDQLTAPTAVVAGETGCGDEVQSRRPATPSRPADSSVFFEVACSGSDPVTRLRRAIATLCAWPTRTERLPTSVCARRT